MPRKRILELGGCVGLVLCGLLGWYAVVPTSPQAWDVVRMIIAAASTLAILFGVVGIVLLALGVGEERPAVSLVGPPPPLTDAQRTELLAFEQAKEQAHTVEVMLAIGMDTAALSQAQSKLTAECQALADRYPEWRESLLLATYQRDLNDPEGLLSRLGWITNELNPEMAQRQPGDLIRWGKIMLEQRCTASPGVFLRDGRAFHFHALWWLERHRPELFVRMRDDLTKKRPWTRRLPDDPEKRLTRLIERDLPWLYRALRP
jgi:hypothetical protein